LPQSSARPAAVGPTHRSPYDFDVSADILADLDWKIDYYVNLSVPDGTRKKDVLAWQRWSMFCSGLGTTPWRMDRDAHSGADPVGFDRETRLLTAFLLHCHEIVKPRSAKDLAAKPDSILNQVLAVRRIHLRRNVSMIPTSQLAAVLRGITSEFIAEHGYEALLPARKDPLDAGHVRLFLSTPTGTHLGRAVVDWLEPKFVSLAGLLTVAASTGFRKAECATPDGKPLDQRRLRRCNLRWRIDGHVFADPSPAQLAALVPGRDSAVLIPPPSKADRFGQTWGTNPIHLPYAPTDAANAAARLRTIELQFPVRGTQRTTTALFFTDAGLSPMRHSSADSLLGHLLKLHLGDDAVRFSFHSFRIGFACTLLAAGCDGFTIQALCRWKSPESLKVYARLNPDDYESTTTRNLPTIDADPFVAQLQADIQLLEARAGAPDADDE